MTLRLPTATLLVLLVLASCSSATDDASITSSIDDTAEVSVATTDTASDVTSSTTTTEATTTTQPSTTSTTVPIEEQVRAAAVRNYENYWSCLHRPSECDVGATTIAGSDASLAFESTISDLVAGGLFVGDEDYGYLVIESVEPQADHTRVTSCWWSTGVLYVQPPVEGEPPVVQNDTPGTIRQVDEFVQDPADGVWKLRRSDVIEQVPEVNQCPPEG